MLEVNHISELIMLENVNMVEPIALFNHVKRLVFEPWSIGAVWL
jgi:hypothetical protein